MFITFAILVSTEPTTGAVTLVACGSNSVLAMTDKNSPADLAGE